MASERLAHRWVVPPHGNEREYLRLFNPTETAVGLRLTPGGERAMEATSIVEWEMNGPLTIESGAPLILTTRHLSEAPSIEGEPQLVVSPRNLQALPSADAACPAIAILTPAMACRFGTSGAVVEAIPGATYTWTVDGAAITAGDGTNRINLAFGVASAASIAVAVRTSDGCSRTGAATVALRDPFRIASLVAPSVTLGNPVTLSWSISGTDVPRSQTLTINGTAVKTATTDRSYTVTPTTLGTYNVQLDASLIGGRRRACCRSDVPIASFCGADARTTSFTVTPPCAPTTGSIAIPSSVIRGETIAGSLTASGRRSCTETIALSS